MWKKTRRIVFRCKVIVSTVLTISAFDAFAQFQVGCTSTQYFKNPEGDGGSTSDATAIFRVPANYANRDRTILVDYQTNDGSAVAPGDYTFTSGTASVMVNRYAARTANINIPVLCDEDAEANESFTVTLSNTRWQDGNPSPDIALTNNPTTMLIVDDDYQPYQILISSIQQQEGSNPADPAIPVIKPELTISLDREIDVYHQVKVRWRINAKASSAKSPGDYITSSFVWHTITFNPGEQAKTISPVTIVEDFNVEGDEFIEIDLANPSSNAILMETQGVITILDDDEADFQITKALYTLDGQLEENNILAGQQYKFVGTITNMGPGYMWSTDRSKIVTLVDPLPATLRYHSCTNKGVYDLDSHSLTWTLSISTAWQAGAARSCEAVVSTAGGLADGTSITNTMRITLPDVHYVEGHTMRPDPSLGNNIALGKWLLINPDVDACGQFDSDRNVGLLPLCAHFYSFKPLVCYNWCFGDGHKVSGPREAHHDYYTMTSSADKTPFDVLLNDRGDDQFITPYAPSEQAYAFLQFVSGSSDHEEESWENAIDGDIYWYNGTASVTADAGEKPWAIFRFIDKRSKKISKIRMMTDTGLDNSEKQVKHIRVFVSTKTMREDDFTLILDAEKSPIVETPSLFNDDWATWELPAINAKYIKLVIDQPETHWRQLGEFEVYTQTTLADANKSTLAAAGNPKPDGVDSALVTLTLVDESGNPLIGRTFADVVFCAVDKYAPHVEDGTAFFGTLLETAKHGVYSINLKSRSAGPKLIRAFVNGVLVNKTSPSGGECCEVIFGKPEVTEGDGNICGLPDNALVFVRGSKTAEHEGWDNAVDGDRDGWDGTTTAKGSDAAKGPAWGIFKFACGKACSFDRVYIQLDNGSDDDEYSYRQATEIELQISVTDDQPASFTSIAWFDNVKPDWTRYVLNKVFSAVFVKVILHQPTWHPEAWRQLVEFSLETAQKKGALLAAETAESTAAPVLFAMEQNYPNPFNAMTVIRFQLPVDSQVKIDIIDINGRLVETLVDGQQSAGYKSVNWNARNAASGLYFCKFQTDGFSEVKRLVVVK